jgi:hypothetical protein
MYLLLSNWPLKDLMVTRYALLRVLLYRLWYVPESFEIETGTIQTYLKSQTFEFQVLKTQGKADEINDDGGMVTMRFASTTIPHYRLPPHCDTRRV